MELIKFIGWFIIYSIFLFLIFGCKSKIDFTEDELKYISTRSVLYAVQENYPPFMYFNDENKLVGISADFLELISKKSGLKLKQGNACFIERCIDMARDGQVQIVPSLRPSPLTTAFMSYTRPYFLVDMIIVKKVKMPARIGILAGTASNLYINIAYPNLLVLEYMDNDSLSIALLDNQIDAIIVNSESVKSIREKYNIQYDQSIIPFDYPVSFGLQKDDHILKSIFDKTIASFTPAEILEITKKWE